MGFSKLWRGRGKMKAMEPEQEPQRSPSSPNIFHQRQRLQLCLLHALNNLFQGETTFSRCELNTIASSLSSAVQYGATSPFSRLFNPHYNIVTGNYDANVLMVAVQSRKGEAVWYDRRKGAAALDLSEPDKKLVGIILNHPTEIFSGLWKGRHWSALRKIDGVWYDLDSYLPAPVPVAEGDDDVKQFLEHSFAGGCEAFLVFRSEGNAGKGTSD